MRHSKIVNFIFVILATFFLFIGATNHGENEKLLLIPGAIVLAGALIGLSVSDKP